MKTIDISRFSARYTVRKLTQADTDMIFALLLTNPQYYLCCGGQPSEALIQSDLTALPPNTSAAQKYYLGFFKGGKLLAVMDLIDGYPEETIAFIGFYMLHGNIRGAGEGSRLICEILSYLKQLGYTAARLGIDKNNSPAVHFWSKNGFVILKEIQKEDCVILYAERLL